MHTERLEPATTDADGRHGFVLSGGEAAAGEQKLQTIKVVRQLTSLGLKDAKALVESAPKPLAEGVSKEEADKMTAALEEVGAKVERK